SAHVTVRIENGELLLSVPVVKMPAGGSAVAALRFVLSNVSRPGQLHQPRLRDDVLVLEYREKVARMHPTKLVDVLRRMPMDADDHDDWLVGQFSALRVAPAPVEPVTDEEFARCQAIWHEHWNDVEELLKESHKKRSLFFLDELTAYALSRVNFAL